MNMDIILFLAITDGFNRVLQPPFSSAFAFVCCKSFKKASDIHLVYTFTITTV